MTTTITPDKDLSSIGKLCVLLHSTPNQIARACEVASIMPRLRLNGCNYYADADIDLIRAALEKKG